MADDSMQAFLVKMHREPAWGQQAVAQAKAGNLKAFAGQGGFTLAAAEATRLAAWLTQEGQTPLTDGELAQITGAGEGSYFQWLDNFMEGA